ncbi:MAG: aminodeoxychorismate/anthranilate synthase component II [Dehalococcoidia bacterium]
MVLVIDNYDSFTYNLVQMLGELGEELTVFRNDKITLGKVAELNPARIVISPGPGRPQDGRISNDVIKAFYQKIPILGVCLGNQCIAYSFGGKVERAKRLMHGKTSMIYHDDKGVFSGLSNPFEATRYHSLIPEKPVPEELEISAWTEEGEIMGLRHRECPLEGVQFHPESILTFEGSKLLRNFVEGAGE